MLDSLDADVDLEPPGRNAIMRWAAGVGSEEGTEAAAGAGEGVGAGTGAGTGAGAEAVMLGGGVGSSVLALVEDGGPEDHLCCIADAREGAGERAGPDAEAAALAVSAETMAALSFSFSCDWPGTVDDDLMD